MAGRFGGFATYGEYLESPHWIALRSHLCRRGRRCYGCQAPSRLQLHHVRYGCLGAERAKDVIVLCKACHQNLHDLLDSRYPKQSKNFKAQQTRIVFPELFKVTLAFACDHNDHWFEFQQHEKLIAPTPPATVEAVGSTARSIAQINIHIQASLSLPNRPLNRVKKKRHKKKKSKRLNRKLQKTHQRCNCGALRPKPQPTDFHRYTCDKCKSKQANRIAQAIKKPFIGKCFACGKKNTEVTSTAGQTTGLCKPCREWQAKHRSA